MTETSKKLPKKLSIIQLRLDKMHCRCQWYSFATYILCTVIGLKDVITSDLVLGWRWKLFEYSSYCRGIWPLCSTFGQSPKWWMTTGVPTISKSYGFIWWIVSNLKLVAYQFWITFNCLVMLAKTLSTTGSNTGIQSPHLFLDNLDYLWRMQSNALLDEMHLSVHYLGFFLLPFLQLVRTKVNFSCWPGKQVAEDVPCAMLGLNPICILFTEWAKYHPPLFWLPCLTAFLQKKNLQELLFKVLDFVAKLLIISAPQKTRAIAQLGCFHIHLLLILSCVVLAWPQQRNQTKKNSEDWGHNIHFFHFLSRWVTWDWQICCSMQRYSLLDFPSALTKSLFGRLLWNMHGDTLWYTITSDTESGLQ